MSDESRVWLTTEQWETLHELEDSRTEAVNKLAAQQTEQSKAATEFLEWQLNQQLPVRLAIAVQLWDDKGSIEDNARRALNAADILIRMEKESRQ